MDRFESIHTPHYIKPMLEGFVLPTRPIIERLLSDLAKMYNADYDLDELVTLSLAAIENKEIAEMRIVEETQTTRKFFHIPLQIRMRDNDEEVRNRAIHDCEVLTNAWFNFTTGLFGICNQINIWDADGIARLYLKRYIHNDIILCRWPE